MNAENSPVLQNEPKVKKSRITLRRREMINGYLFVLIWIIGFVFFFAKNFAQTFDFSVHKIEFSADVAGYTKTWYGLKNYTYTFTEQVSNGIPFNRHLYNSIINMVVDVPMIIFISLFLALMLNREFKFRGLARALFFLPVLLAAPAVQQAIRASMNNIAGGANELNYMMEQNVVVSGFNAQIVLETLREFRIPANLITYVQQAIGRIFTLINASGVQILIFLAALQSIPTSLYEVAKIEGATTYEAFWKITLPMVSPLILTNVIYTIVMSYKNSYLYTWARSTAFVTLNFGLGSAMIIVTSMTVCLLLLAVGFLISRFVFYQV